MQSWFADYPRYEYLLASLQLVFVMTGMGATLEVRDFADVFQKPRSFLVGLASLFLLGPLVATAISWWWALKPGLTVGLFVISVMPGGTLKNLFSYLGGGNLALSLALTACGSLLALVVVPLMLPILVSEAAPGGVPMPTGEVLWEIFLKMGLPVVAGMAFARWRPAWRAVFSRWCIRLGLLLVVVVVVGSLGNGRIHPGEHGLAAPLAIIVFCVVMMQLAMVPFRLFRWPIPDRLAVGLEVTMRNCNLALLLKALLFPAAAEKGMDPVADGVLFVVIFYAATSLVASVPLAFLTRRKILRALERQQAEAERRQAQERIAASA
jgi:BASS family bile acid:Na+ symporter